MELNVQPSDSCEYTMKRLANANSTKKSAKKQKVSSATSKNQGKEQEKAVEWSEYFHDVSWAFVHMNSLAKLLSTQVVQGVPIEPTHFLVLTLSQGLQGELPHMIVWYTHARHYVGTQYSSCICVFSQASCNYISGGSYLSRRSFEKVRLISESHDRQANPTADHSNCLK